jgi:uncharacterized membrane protein
VTIGLFMGTFIYICLVFLVTHQNASSVFIPQVSLITSWVLVVASFGFLVYYSHRIASSIQNPDLVARIADDVHPAAAGACARAAGEGTGAAPDEATIARESAEGVTVSCSQSGYIQQIDHAELVAAAARAEAKVIMRFRPGQFVLRGEALAAVCPADRAPALASKIVRAVAIGRHRTLTQDPEFAVAQIVEIAIRALSPAINDTFTGVACVDWLADAILVLAENPPTEGNWYDRSGHLRVWTPEVRLERLIRLAFDQIRQAASDNPAILIRILDKIRRIAPRIPAGPPRATLTAEADAIREAAAAKVTIQLDRQDVDRAWEQARAALE